MHSESFKLNRRAFLSTASAALLVQAARGMTLIAPDTKLRTNPFLLGVASGDPMPDGVVLWTRLSTDTRRGDGGLPASALPVRWEVATDAGFRHIVQKGTASATPEMGHAVHVEVTGCLRTATSSTASTRWMRPAR